MIDTLRSLIAMPFQLFNPTYDANMSPRPDKSGFKATGALVGNSGNRIYYWNYSRSLELMRHSKSRLSSPVPRIPIYREMLDESAPVRFPTAPTGPDKSGSKPGDESVYLFLEFTINGYYSLLSLSIFRGNNVDLNIVIQSVKKCH